MRHYTIATEKNKIRLVSVVWIRLDGDFSDVFCFAKSDVAPIGVMMLLTSFRNDAMFA